MEYSQSVCALNLHKEINIVKDLVKGGTKHIHLDFMDFKITNSFGLRIEEAKNLMQEFPKVIFDAHLMCQNPVPIIEKLSTLGIKIFFVDLSEYKKIDFQSIEKKLNIEISVYLKKEDKIENLKKIISLKKNIMVMTIDKIGGTGQLLNEDLLKKVVHIKRINPQIKVYSDGGFRNENVFLFAKHKVDVAVGGSIARTWEDKKKFNDWIESQ